MAHSLMLCEVNQEDYDAVFYPGGHCPLWDLANDKHSISEEEAVGLTKIVPFLLESELQKLGAKYSKGENWSSYVKKDGLLITGQNPASSAETAQLLLGTLNLSTR